MTPPPVPRPDVLRTARLTLRRARAEDLGDIHAIMSDAEVMAFWSTPPHATLAETAAWLQGMLEAPADEADEFVMVRDGRVIGKVGAWRRPEIGVYLRRDCWGEGLAAEALAAYVAHARAQGQSELTADVDPENARCLRLLTGAGFHETGRAKGTFVLGDRVCDSVYLRLDLSPDA